MKVAAAADAIVGRLNTNKKLATFSVSGGAIVVTGGNIPFDWGRDVQR